jgi:uncharacterized protein affecting Mg2+/Co2+ transport
MRKLLRFILPCFLTGLSILKAQAQTKEIQLPSGVTYFGVTVLTNGNIVIASPGHSDPGKSHIGVVFLFNGKTFELISTLKGEKAGDSIGSNVVALPNGNFVVVSTSWSDGAIQNAGAVTWVNGVTGLEGVVNTSNSLTGSTTWESIGVNGITVLTNGNYLVRSYAWRTPGKNYLGAVTWCNGNTGLTGKVNATNSLVGASNDDYVGWETILVLPNGNYVVGSPQWDNGAAANVGAVTWCDGSTGRTGVIGPGNSLIGTSAGDMISKPLGGDDPRLVALTNGNYVVSSPYWKNGSLDSAGAVTWGNGAVGTVGVVSAANSLVGGSAKDFVGAYKPVALTNGNYVVSSPSWKNGAAENAGAVTWGNGSTGTTGLVSESNSLVGTDGTDYVGGVQPVFWPIFSLESDSPAKTVVPLTNGNYVVVSRNWNRNGLKWAGAVTWGNGTTGTTGPVKPANSLVGTSSMDRVGHLGVAALANGHYVVSSPLWSDGAKLKAGAVTWCDGYSGRIGEVTAANSFVGTKQDDNVGSRFITALTNGNYVIQTRGNPINGVEMAGMATWADGSAMLTGSPNAGNSLYGTQPNDLVGNYVTPLQNGNYLVQSDYWNGAAQYAGAITVGNGSTGISGAVSASNSLVGSYYGDRLGIHGQHVLPGGAFFVESTSWKQSTSAVIWGDGATGLMGELNDCNSVLESNVGRYNTTYNYLIAYKPANSRFFVYYPTGGPFLSKNSDTGSATIYPSQAASLMGGTGGCRIIATVASQGASPVTGDITAKAWIETGVPTFGGDPFVARHYEITPQQNAASATGRVTLYFSQEEFNAFNAAPSSTLDLPSNADDGAGKANLRIGKYSGTSNNGTGLPGSYPSIASTIIDPADSDIIWNDTFKRWEVTFDTEGFSGFVVQTSTVPLPVRLVSFTAKTEGNSISLKWQIADAVNVSHFEVERSNDAKGFEYVGKVNFVEGTENYAFTDGQPLSGTDGQTYYRLKMVDADGTYAYSKVANVRFDHANIAYVYPNPSKDHFTVLLPEFNGKTGVLKLVNASGETVLSEPFTVVNDEVSMDLKRSRLAEGIYTIRLDLGKETRQFKLVKSR